MVKSLSLLVHLNQKRRGIYKHMRRRMNEKYNDNRELYYPFVHFLPTMGSRSLSLVELPSYFISLIAIL
jgi:hypothetical protein